MKIGICQINTVVGDIDYNVNRMKRAAIEVKKKGAEIAVFPELTITGYPPKDFLLNEKFIDRNIKAAEEIGRFSSELRIPIIFGYVERTTWVGKPLCNTAVVTNPKCPSDLYAGGWKRKTLLPTYDVFDESRWFNDEFTGECGETFEGDIRETKIGDRNVRIGLSVCEDIWNDEIMGDRPIYEINPIADMVNTGVDILINISASPYQYGRKNDKIRMFSKIAYKYDIPLVYVNSVGGNDSLIFDGGSLAMNSCGSSVGDNIHYFKEWVDVLDVPLRGEVNEFKCSHSAEYVVENIGDVANALILGVNNYMRKTGFKKAVIGLSGGIDSAVTAVIAVKALGKENVTGITMPSEYSSEGSVVGSVFLAKNLGIPCYQIPIKKIVEQYKDSVYGGIFKFEGVAEENIQSRIRGNILMGFSNSEGALVLSTGNKSEMALGYCTLYGDMSGGLAVLSDVPKTMVYEIAEYLNTLSKVIPKNIIEKAPSAELRPNQKDSDSLPPYYVIDKVIELFVESQMSFEEILDRTGFDAEVIKSIIKKIVKNEYKRRQSPPGIRITSKAFTVGWDMPIAIGNAIEGM